MKCSCHCWLFREVFCFRLRTSRFSRKVPDAEQLAGPFSYFLLSVFFLTRHQQEAEVATSFRPRLSHKFLCKKYFKSLPSFSFKFLLFSFLERLLPRLLKVLKLPSPAGQPHQTNGQRHDKRSQRN